MQWFKIVFLTSGIKRNDSYCMLLDLLQVMLLVYIRRKLRSIMIWSSGPNHRYRPSLLGDPSGSIAAPVG